MRHAGSMELRKCHSSSCLFVSSVLDEIMNCSTAITRRIRNVARSIKSHMMHVIIDLYFYVMYMSYCLELCDFISSRLQAVSTNKAFEWHLIHEISLFNAEFIYNILLCSETMKVFLDGMINGFRIFRESSV